MSLQEVDVVGVSHADADLSRLRAPCSRDKATIPVAGNMEWSVGVRHTYMYRVVQKKRGHSTFSQISRKLLKISK